MIVLFIFCLLVLTDILEIMRYKQFRKNLDKRQFINLLFVFGGALFAIYMLGNLFYLNSKYQIYLMVLVGISVLLISSYSLKHLKNKYDFEDLSQYMLRLCVYFRAHQKIYPSLIDAGSGFDGNFRKKVDSVLKSYQEQGNLEQAISKLSSHYLMQSLIEVFKASEDIGHYHSTQQLIRLEQDIEAWIYQTKSYQKNEAQLRNRMLMLFGIGMIISYFAQNMLMQSFDMKSLLLYQKLIFTFLSANIFCIILLCKRLTYSWFLKREDL